MQAPFSGMICIKHFTDDDLLKATKSMPIRLKKGVVPRIFNSMSFVPTENNQNENNQNDEYDENNANNEDENDDNHGKDGNSIKCLKKDCEIMRIEYANLKEEHFRVKMSHHIGISKMEIENERLKSVIKKQTNNLNRLNHQVTRAEKSKNSLSLLLQDLEQQKILSEEASNILQVCWVCYSRYSGYFTHERYKISYFRFLAL